MNLNILMGLINIPRRGYVLIMFMSYGQYLFYKFSSIYFYALRAKWTKPFKLSFVGKKSFQINQLQPVILPILQPS